MVLSLSAGGGNEMSSEKSSALASSARRSDGRAVAVGRGNGRGACALSKEIVVAAAVTHSAVAQSGVKKEQQIFFPLFLRSHRKGEWEG